MNFYSFDLHDPLFTIGKWQLSFQIVTLENLYGLDPAAITVQETADTWTMDCTRLSWAGQQQHAPGSLRVRIQKEANDQLRITMEAEAPTKIRLVKLVIRNLPVMQALDLLDAPRDVPHGGMIDNYPSALQLPVPLWFVRLPDGSHLGLRAEDPHARAKRFVAFQERLGTYAGTYTVECIHEEDARWFDTHMTVPTWILGYNVDVNTFRDQQLAFAETAFGLERWEQRSNTPAWVRDIRLCVTLHGMHWSGYIFNTYADMLRTLRFVAERIEGRHVLAYLAGWEGRYYWQYGDYRPEPMLGGAEGFAELCRESAALGIHIMPMFGGNVVNAWLPNFHTYGPSSYLKSATRLVFDGNQPDWDLARAHDNGWQAWLNPGAPAWQTEFTRQILSLRDQFGFDSVFIDTIQHWANDPDFNLREGLHQLVARLRDGRPDLMVMAEDWWDGILDLFPFYLRSGWWRKVPPWIKRYARLLGHICDGEASRGSTGVHEDGSSPYARMPDAPLYIPTITFVDGTLAQAQAEIEAVIAQAKDRR